MHNQMLHELTYRSASGKHKGPCHPAIHLEPWAGVQYSETTGFLLIYHNLDPVLIRAGRLFVLCAPCQLLAPVLSWWLWL